MGMRHTLAARNLPDKISNAKKMPHKGAEHISRVLPVALEKLLANRPSETTEGQLLHLPDLQQAGGEAAVGNDQRQDGLRGELRETPLIERGHPLLTGYPFPIRRLTSLGHLNSSPIDSAPKPVEAVSSPVIDTRGNPLSDPAATRWWLAHPHLIQQIINAVFPVQGCALPPAERPIPTIWEKAALKLAQPIEIVDIDVMPGLMPAPMPAYEIDDITAARARQQVVAELDKLLKVA